MSMPLCAARRKTNIERADYARLKQLLLSRPREALLHFAESGIGCLAELELFWEINAQDADAGCRIVIEAASLGMPLGERALFRGRI